MTPLDGAPGYHHHRPEGGQRLPEAFVVLPVGRERAAAHSDPLWSVTRFEI